MKTLIRVDIGDIARPNAIGLLGIEVLLQDVPAARIILFRPFPVCSNRLFRRHPGQLHSPHQPVHSSHADLYAIFRLEAPTHFMSAEPLVRTGVQVQDLPSDILIFKNSRGDRTEKMLVIRTPVDP